MRESCAACAASVVMRTPDTLSFTRIARFLRMFLSEGAPTAEARDAKRFFMLRFFGASSAARPRDGEMSFDREPGHCVARVATSGRCLAASSGRHASGRPGSRPLGRAGAAARPPHARPRKPVLELGADETVRRTVRGERRSCRSPRPRPRAPCPRRTRTRRCPRRRRETPRPRRPRTPEGS